jgi:TonB family protein
MSGDGAVFAGGVGRDWGVADGAATPVSRLGPAGFSADARSGEEVAEAFDGEGVVADQAWVMAPTRAAVGLGTARPWIVLASILAHAGALALLILFAPPPAPIAPPVETPIEIVREEPPEAKTPEVVKKPEPPAQAKVEPAKPEPAKPEPPPEPPKPEAPKPEPPKLEAAKPEPPKPEPAKPPTPRAEPKVAKVEPPKPSAADLAKQAEDARAVQAMREELAALEAQKADLKAQADALAAQAAQEQAAAATKAAADASAGAVDHAFGPLPPSFAAVALPSDAAAGDVAVTYEQQVFSQLAKAKKAGKHVVAPGIAHVVFHIDDAGKLLDVTLDHPSGDAFLDGEAVAIVRRAAPFPPPPPGGQRVFSASMRFRIDE